MRPLIVFFLLFLSSKTFAYFSLMDTGELRQGQNTRLLGETQIITDIPRGFNFNGRYILGSSEFIPDSELQFEAGAGSVDYQLGVFFKWIPFPDTDKQPAIGLRTGLTFAKFIEYSTYGLNITPLISKHINSDFGKITPYLGLPVGLQKNTLNFYTSFHVAIGLEWSPEEWELGSSRGINILLEYGMGISQAFDYLSLALAYDFE